MDGRIERIVIVGGGTAGWLSATYLQRALGESIAITLVESKDIPGVGVGEATIPTLRTTLGFIGLADAEWMPKVGATYKAAIKFVDWVDPARKTDDHFWHPFTQRPEPAVLPFERPYFQQIGTRVSLLHYAHRRRLEGASQSLAEMIAPNVALCMARKSPIHPSNPDMNQSTAYHFDAVALARLLRGLAIERGVSHVVDDVTSVELDERGFIKALHTKGGANVEGDLFIDCTGFRGALLQRTLQEPFLSDSNVLLCDAAVALPATNDPDRDGIAPYTTSTALTAGWAWDVP